MKHHAPLTLPLPVHQVGQNGFWVVFPAPVWCHITSCYQVDIREGSQNPIPFLWKSNPSWRWVKAKSVAVWRSYFGVLHLVMLLIRAVGDERENSCNVSLFLSSFYFMNVHCARIVPSVSWYACLTSMVCQCKFSFPSMNGCLDSKQLQHHWLFSLVHCDFRNHLPIQTPLVHDFFKIKFDSRRERSSCSVNINQFFYWTGLVFTFH